MFRIFVLALLCAGLPGCAGIAKAVNDRADEIIDANKIPDASITPEQVALLKTLSEDSEVVWTKAGIQGDGKLFVCYVSKTPQKNIWGKRLRDLIYVHAGVFDSPDVFKELSTTLLRGSGWIECNGRGIRPPVRQVLRHRFDISD